MATFIFFDEFKKYLADGTIDLDNDTFKLYLSNNAPTVATHTVKADIAGITVENGYNEITITTPSWAETAGGSGVWRFAGDADEVWTASGGAFGPFRYVILYDDTPAATPTDPLVGYWDYGSSISITDTNTFTLDLDANYEIFTLDG
jgi:hypothetical protein